MNNWKQQVIALLQGLITEIEQTEVPESVLLEVDNIYKDVSEILEEEAGVLEDELKSIKERLTELKAKN